MSDKARIARTDSQSSFGQTDPIGSTRTFQERRMASFRKTILERGGSEEELNNLTASELVNYNPLLANYTPTTRLAYAKFKSFTLRGQAEFLQRQASINDDEDSVTTFESESETASAKKPSQKLQSLLQKKASVASISIMEENEAGSPAKNGSKVNNKLIYFSPDQSRVEQQQSPTPSQKRSHKGSPKTSKSESHSQALAVSPKIFPRQGRTLIGIQSPLASPVNLPPSPLPPRDVPTTKESLAVADAICNEAASEEPANDEEEEARFFSTKRRSSTEVGKSVITGQVRTGWL